MILFLIFFQYSMHPLPCKLYSTYIVLHPYPCHVSLSHDPIPDFFFYYFHTPSHLHCTLYCIPTLDTYPFPMPCSPPPAKSPFTFALYSYPLSCLLRHNMQYLPTPSLLYPNPMLCLPFPKTCLSSTSHVSFLHAVTPILMVYGVSVHMHALVHDLSHSSMLYCLPSPCHVYCLALICSVSLSPVQYHAICATPPPSRGLCAWITATPLPSSQWACPWPVCTPCDSQLVNGFDVNGETNGHDLHTHAHPQSVNAYSLWLKNVICTYMYICTVHISAIHKCIFAIRRTYHTNMHAYVQSINAYSL